jgi:D-serine deaminase-like pyridoxal phosphate-dependent protein
VASDGLSAGWRTPLLDETAKGWRLAPGETLSGRDVPRQGWNALRGDLELPVMLLHETALAQNLRTMREYCGANGVALAPHAKTSMSPEITHRQLLAGAWAITAATPGQVRRLHAFGVRRILLANVLVDATDVRWVAEHLLHSDETGFVCYVDGIAGIELMEKALSGSPPPRPLDVMVEVGFRGGRTGVRSVPDAIRLAEAVLDSPSLRLAGVAGFEGLVPGGGTTSQVPEGVGQLLEDIGHTARTLHREGLAEAGRPLIVTVGGSAYFDRVVDQLSPSRFDFPVLTVLRSGCYVTHDHGAYQEVSALGERGGRAPAQRLRPAFELLASVWSRPEPDLVIAGFGRRDVPIDDRLPVVLRNHSRSDPLAGPTDFEVVALNDQHALVRIPAHSRVAVGDVLGVGISHPCGAFDRWRFIPVVSDEYDVVSCVSTYF